MNKVKIALYTCEDNFETEIQTVCLKGDTLYGYEKEIRGCAKDYVPWTVIYLYTTNTKKYIGYLTKDSELIKFKKYV